MQKGWLKPANGLMKKFANIHQFCNGDIHKFVLLLKRVFIRMNTWIAGEDLMEHFYQRKKLFTGNCIQKTLLINTTHMLKKYLKVLK